VLKAQHRGRSVQHDYTEYVSNAAQAHRSAVLELFNLTLGWGPASDAFWSGTQVVCVLDSSCVCSQRNTLCCALVCITVQ
jgi:hypothetical protein